jgi:hypothetical protein
MESNQALFVHLGYNFHQALGASTFSQIHARADRLGDRRIGREHDLATGPPSRELGIDVLEQGWIAVNGIAISPHAMRFATVARVSRDVASDIAGTSTTALGGAPREACTVETLAGARRKTLSCGC